MENFMGKNGFAVLIMLLLIFSAWFFTREKQADNLYELSGSEILEVKEKCRLSAIETELIRQIEGGWQSPPKLVGWGYSEYGGFCYAEFLVYTNVTSKSLYNTTEGKRLTIRKWPEDVNLYEKDFNSIVLGKR